MKTYISQQHVNTFFVGNKKTVYGVLFIHYELWIFGENKTELCMKFDKVTYSGIK